MTPTPDARAGREAAEALLIDATFETHAQHENAIDAIQAALAAAHAAGLRVGVESVLALPKFELLNGVYGADMVSRENGTWIKVDDAEELLSPPPAGAVGVAVNCTVCGLRKKPIGRDSRDNGLCDHECEGYRLDPQPGHLWPGEVDDERQPPAETERGT